MKYKVKRKCFYKSVLYRPGEIVELDETDAPRYKMQGLIANEPEPEPKTRRGRKRGKRTN